MATVVRHNGHSGQGKETGRERTGKQNQYANAMVGIMETKTHPSFAVSDAFSFSCLISCSSASTLSASAFFSDSSSAALASSSCLACHRVSAYSRSSPYESGLYSFAYLLSGLQVLFCLRQLGGLLVVLSL